MVATILKTSRTVSPDIIRLQLQLCHFHNRRLGEEEAYLNMLCTSGIRSLLCLQVAIRMGQIDFTIRTFFSTQFHTASPRSPSIPWLYYTHFDSRADRGNRRKNGADFRDPSRLKDLADELEIMAARERRIQRKREQTRKRLILSTISRTS